jgi:hypothetical protein
LWQALSNEGSAHTSGAAGDCCASARRGVEQISRRANETRARACDDDDISRSWGGLDVLVGNLGELAYCSFLVLTFSEELASYFDKMDE